MAGWENPFRNIQFVLQPGSRKLKMILLALILACTAALVALGVVQGRIRQQTQSALDQAAQLEQENAGLSQAGDNLDTDAIRNIAREELGLVDPDTIIIDPN